MKLRLYAVTRYNNENKQMKLHGKYSISIDC